MAEEENTWCKDCLKIPLNQIFRPGSRARARKFVLPTHKDARHGRPECAMCHFTRATRRLYDDAYLVSYGHRPEPSVSTGKVQSVLLGGSKHSPWPAILAAETTPHETFPGTVHAWFTADTASHQESSEPAVLITYEDAVEATNPLPRQRSKHELQESTVDAAMLRDWMHSTEQGMTDSPTHPLSPSRSRGTQTLRLIDVNRRRIVSADTSYRYLALSYVWGTQLPQQDWLTSLSETKSAKSHGMLPAHLPDTFEDALKLTLDLGEYYLWIDLFCIKQDDPRHVVEQIERMHHIYACATCTIVAYDSEDAFSGLAGVSRPLELRAQPIVNTPSGGRLMATWLPSADVRRGVTFPWNSRAWCFQEKFFSRRLLYLQRHEILLASEQAVQHDIFRLDTAIRFEDWSHYPSIASLRGQRFLKAYSDLLHDYTSRFLTHPADAINAFSGILSALKHETHQDFSYGIPLGESHRGLLWSAADEHVLSPREGFPTWSWCGWLGPVRYRDYLFAEQPRKVSPRVSETTTTHNGDEHHQNTPERAHLSFPRSETWSQSLHHSDHILHVRSSVIACTIRKLPQSREPSALTYLTDTQGMTRKQDLGYHWTLLDPQHHDGLPDPANNPCWPDLFDASPHWFRFSAAEEAILEEVSATTGDQKRSARLSSATKSKPKTLQVTVEIILIKRWPMVRDASGKVIRDAVGGLVVVPVVPRDINSIGRRTRNLRRRVAAVLMEGRTFDAFDPTQKELDLV